MDIKQLTKELCSLNAPSGRENGFMSKLSPILGEYFDEALPCGVNSYLFIKRCGAENAPRVLIDAHFDQIGMIVKGIGENGELSFTSLGGLDLRTLLSSYVTVTGEKGEVTGVISYTKPDYLPLAMENMRIETFKTKEDLDALGIGIGSSVTLNGGFVELKNSRFASRSLDNRISAVAAAYAVTLPQINDCLCDIYLLLSSEEETYGAGIITGTETVIPDLAIIVDVDLGRTPDTDKSSTVKLGEGPSVAISIQCDRKLTKKLLTVAKEKEIPVQEALNPISTGTNGTDLIKALEGVRSLVVGIPLENMHTTYEIAHEEDVKNTGRLIAELLASEYPKKKEDK